MTIVQIIIILVVLAIGFWAISIVQMDARLKQILCVVAVVLILIWVLTQSGLLHSM